jgi:hypothetical protein
MSDHTVGKYTGTGTVNAAPYKDKLVDVKDGNLNRFRRSKPKLALVLAELSTAMQSHGNEARIHPDTYQEILETVAVLGLIRKDLPDVQKLAQVMRESEVYYEDKLEALISRLGKTVLDTAHTEKKPGLVAVFDQTLSYRSEYADKAAATRKKNQAAAQAPEAANEPDDSAG